MCRCSFSLKRSQRLHFKRKNGKKESISERRRGKKPKGNGISAEGWQGTKNNIGEADLTALPLCRSLLAFLKQSFVIAAYFCDLFFPYFILIEKINSLNEYQLSEVGLQIQEA